MIPLGIFHRNKDNFLDVEVKLAEDKKEIKSLKYRMKDVETQTEAIHSLALSVNELAGNIQTMSKTQTDVVNRLTKLEQAPLTHYDYLKKTIIGCIVTGVLTAIISALLAVIIR